MKKVICLLLILLFSQGQASQPFVTTTFLGQLGNQMFQIAAAVSLALDHQAQPIFSELLTEKRLGIPENYNYIFWRLSVKPRIHQNQIAVIYKEPSFSYAPIPYYPNMRIEGYYQSEKYFRHHKNEIISLFEPHPKILAYLENKYSHIIYHPMTVSIHVRTYLFDAMSLKYFSFNGVDYLQKAVELFPKEALFVVFSDDIAWCKANLKTLAPNICFIEGEKHYYDFYLMSLCKHNIISNSTFSWWAAYLNHHPEKIVVAPERWFEPLAISMGFDPCDIVPDEWIRL